MHHLLDGERNYKRTKYFSSECFEIHEEVEVTKFSEYTDVKRENLLAILIFISLTSFIELILNHHRAKF